MERHDLTDLLGDVLEVGAVADRQHHGGQPGAVGGQHLLAHAADGQHPALQGDLPGHAHHRGHRLAPEQADQGGGHGDSRRRPVLGDGARWHMEVEPLAGEGGRVDAELLGVRPHVGQGDLRRLLHHVAQLPGQGQPLRPVHHRRLHVEDVPAGAGHGQAGGNPGNGRAVGGLEEEARPAEPVADVRSVDAERQGGVASGDARRHLAQEPAELPLERAHPCLAGVVGHDGPQGVVGDDHLVLGQGGALELAPDQVVAGDGDLLVLGVPVEPDDLHPVEQGPGDGVDHVGSGQEQHLGEVELDLEVVVAEGVVLRRIEDLQQG